MTGNNVLKYRNMIHLNYRIIYNFIYVRSESKMYYFEEARYHSNRILTNGSVWEKYLLHC